MTFTEAAIDILRRAGKPLRAAEIAEIALKENLLSHVGQTPEQTMEVRLTSMAKMEVDRKIVAVEPGIFALVEWGAVANPAALEAAPAAAAEEMESLRPRERHPPLVRAGGRHGEEVRRKRRFPPPAEVAFEWLQERGEPATLDELALGLRDGDLIADGLARDLASLQAALAEDNRRRTEAGRKPAFVWSGSRVALLEKFPGGEPLTPPAGRERGAPAAAAPPAALQVAEDAARAGVAALHRRLRDAPAAAFERAVVLLLEKMGYRDLRAAKRGRDGPLYAARRRMGVGELRFAVRILRGRDAGRNEVQEMRRDIAHHGAQVGTLVVLGEVRRDAVAEAGASGQAPVILYGGRQVAEKMASRGLGVRVQTIEVTVPDEPWFASLPAAIEEAPRAAEGGPEEGEAPAPEGAPAEGAPQPGAEERGGRRRRRRRGRGRGRDRGEGPRPPGAPGDAQAPGEGTASAEAPSPAPAEPVDQAPDVRPQPLAQPDPAKPDA